MRVGKKEKSDEIIIHDHIWRDDLDDRPVLVSIDCLAYNHEKYIRDALDGFVMQQTNFRFEAIVHDDASTDGTAEIIREYAEKYPSIIKPIFETENQYCKRDGSLGKIMRAHMRGKYIALCEGDDYWTDPFKLQKQVDFLESHPDCSLVFANVRYHYESGLSNDTFQLEDREYRPIEPYRMQVIATPTVLVRADVYRSVGFLKLQQIKRPVMGDLTLFMAASQVGKLCCMNQVVGGYRRLSTGATNFLYAKPYLWFKNRRDIAKILHLGKEFAAIDVNRFSFYFLWAIKNSFHDFPDNISFAIALFRLSPRECFKECKKKIGRIFMRNNTNSHA